MTYKEKNLKNIQLSKGVVLVNPDRCTGCRTCEMVCSLYHEKKFSRELARIKVLDSLTYFTGYMQYTCLQCVEPVCLQSCPTNAIILDKASGTNARIILEKDCIGCKFCIEACPFDPSRILFNEKKGVAIKCNLCEGDPQCVKHCMFNALIYYSNKVGVKTGYGGCSDTP